MAEAMTFARSLYSPEAVRAAAEAFAELAKIEVTVAEDEIQLAVSEPDPDVADVLEDELANFALAETVVRARR
jgi:hypothetical protein